MMKLFEKIHICIKAAAAAAKSMISRYVRFFRDIVFPSVCCICGEIKDTFFVADDVYFCADGMKIKSHFCKTCTHMLERSYGPYVREGKKELVRVPAVYLFDYDYETIKHLMIHIKTQKCRDCCGFFARSLESVMEKAGAAGGGNITFIPRPAVRRLIYGFDQSERISKTFVRLNPNHTFHNCLNRKISDKYSEQKLLTVRERLENAESSLKINYKCPVPKSMVVFDDMITTGATAKVSCDLLYKSGAENIFLLFLTGKSKKKGVDKR